MEIFIGSSSESKKVMRQIAVWLEDMNLTPLPWDRSDLFVAGDHTFQSIIQISKRPNLGGAIFIFSEDDAVWKDDVTYGQPRDNVLIEYGIFIGALGAKKAIICRNGQPKMATDVLGITYVSFDPLKLNTAQDRVQQWTQTL